MAKKGEKLSDEIKKKLSEAKKVKPWTKEMDMILQDKIK